MAKKWCFLCGEYLGDLDYGQAIEHACEKCKDECEAHDHYGEVYGVMFGAVCGRCKKSWFDG